MQLKNGVWCTSMIKFEKVTKLFRDRTILNEVSLDAEKGKTTVLLGSSGSGKSTLLRLVMKLIEPQRGEIYLNDCPVSRIPLEKLRHQIGYMIQNGGLFPHLTAKENICLMPKILKWNVDRINEKIIQLISLSRFPKEALSQYPGQLSGGQKQRVSLMRALILDPPVLLLDEPLGALDPITRYELQQELKEVFQRLEKTVILVTHDLAEAHFLGDQIALMHEGKILQKGKLRDFEQNPIDPYVTQFIRAQRRLPV